MSLKTAALKALERNRARNLSATPPNAPATLESRVRAMAARWEYSPDEHTQSLRLAAEDPIGWLRLVEHDECLRYVGADESPERPRSNGERNQERQTMPQHPTPPTARVEG